MLRMIGRITSIATFLALVPFFVFAQSGKISGQVTDAETGEPLPGVNVILEGTTKGATTNAEGYYNILNVQPGTYTVQASFVGYATQTVEGVEVNVDLTTELNIEMREQTQELQEVTVQAQERIVKPDVSANVANVSAEDMENMPVASVEEVIGLTAGVQGLSIRGGDASSVSFRVDGSSQFDSRSHQPFTGVSYTAISQVQVQTGGFNAEYGNLRSGLVNVVTKDAPRNRYTIDILGRYTPPTRQYFGDTTPADTMSFFQRPWMDPMVAFEGTDSDQWDVYDRRQYRSWQGWDEYAGNNDQLNAEQWQDVFEWYHDKSFEIETPDYTVDGSVGGPVPVVSDFLGDLRFMASYRRTQDAYIIPQHRPAHRDWLGRLKLTTDLAQGVRLELRGMRSKEWGHTSTRFGYGPMYSGERGASNNMVGNYFSHVTNYESMIFGDAFWNVQDIWRNQYGGKLTHTLGQNTFYELEVNRFGTEYRTHKAYDQPMDTVRSISGYGLIDAPQGCGAWDFTYEVPGDNMALGQYMCSAFDTSGSARWTGRFDMTSQLSRFSQVKGGVDVVYTDQKRKSRYQALQTRSVIEDWDRAHSMGAAYLQNKLEFEGLIANVGLRADYFNPIGNWYTFSPFDSAFGASQVPLEERFGEAPAEGQLTLSPRLGISFPVTANSKFFFNYGHFREIPEPNNIFFIDRVGSVGRIGNPRIPMSRTISYEIGYEHNIFNQFLLRLTGYYKDLSLQPRNVSFIGDEGQANYNIALPYDYEDVRGFEASLSRTTGWVRGFANFTFMARKSGVFGYGTYYENPVDNQEYRRQYRNTVFDPVPQPYARVNLEFIAPPEFGPQLGTLYPLGDWRFNILGNWEAGRADTYCGGGGACPPQVQNNIRWRDDWNVDLRLSKNISTRLGRVQLFADVANALNHRTLNTTGGFNGAFVQFNADFRRYMESLHLPEDTFEGLDPEPIFVPGSDQPGDFRSRDVQFVPIEAVNELPDEGMTRTRGRYGPLYYQASNEEYYIWNEDAGAFEEAADGRVQEVLDKKAYIDMPNMKSFWFLYPREITFGLRITL